MDINSFFLLIIYVVIAITIFLALREIICWYFKINERITILNDIRKSLNPKRSQTSDKRSKDKESDDQWECNGCSAINSLRWNVCQGCGKKRENDD
jgi:hypothetical protein